MVTVRDPYVAGGSISVMVITLLVVLGVGGEQASMAVNDLTAVASAFLAAVLCFRAGGRGGHDRRGWRLLGIASLLWAFGEGAWSFSELVLSNDVPFPSVADVAYLAAVLPAMAGLLAFTRGFESGRRLRTLFDAAMVALGMLQVCWALVLGPAWHGGGPVLDQVVNVAYPVTDLMLLTVALIVFGWGRAEHRSALTAVAASFVTMAGSDVAFTWMFDHGTYSSTNPISLGWVVAYLILGFAARLPVPAEATIVVARADSTLALLLPCVVVSAAMLVVAPRLLQRDPLGTLLAVNGVLLVVLALVRQAVTTLDLRNTVRALYVREAHLGVLAHQDGLTGVANRARFARDLQAALEDDPRRVAVVYLDLDGFKAVNDRFGHAVGDRVLVHVARRLEACADPGMLVARLGGDEFVVMVPTGESDAVALAQRALLAFSAPLEVEGEQFAINASIGIAAASGAGSADDTLRRADAAMYLAKSSGKGRLALHPDEALVA